MDVTVTEGPAWTRVVVMRLRGSPGESVVCTFEKVYDGNAWIREASSAFSEHGRASNRGNGTKNDRPTAVEHAYHKSALRAAWVTLFALDGSFPRGEYPTRTGDSSGARMKALAQHFHPFTYLKAHAFRTRYPLLKTFYNTRWFFSRSLIDDVYTATPLTSV